MVTIFFSTSADRVLQNVLAAQGRFALYAILGQNPAEKLDAGRGEVPSDEVESRAGLVTTTSAKPQDPLFFLESLQDPK